MNVRTPLVFAAVAMVVAGVAAPASAGITDVKVTITVGALEITVPNNTPETAVDLGSLPAVPGGVISGQLGVVQVLDNRNSAPGTAWVASVISTAFTPPAGPTIAASLVGYVVGPLTKQGTVTLVAHDPPNLVGQVAAVSASAITGNNSASWNPTIKVTVPGGMASGVYIAMITHSVA